MLQSLRFVIKFLWLNVLKRSVFFSQADKINATVIVLHQLSHSST